MLMIAFIIVAMLAILTIRGLFADAINDSNECDTFNDSNECDTFNDFDDLDE